MVHHRSPQEAKVAFFGALFAARTDVYAVRYDNQRTGKSGWVPAVRGGWQKAVRHEDPSYLPLTAAVPAGHLKGFTSGCTRCLTATSAGGWRLTSTGRKRCSMP
jgi:hypothetical protein